jgi:hypothetical protein
MVGVCRLCDREAVLEESHVIPSFVYKWLKDSSWTGVLRCGLQPNKRVQDGYKFFWLCGMCEDRLSTWETTFATLVFYPFNKEETDTVSYEAWLLKFCTSISWRVLNLFIEEDNFYQTAPEPVRDAARRAYTVWKEFLLDKRPHPERHEQHLLPLDTIQSYKTPDIPTNINRYILRTVDIDVAWSSGKGKNIFTYAKLGRFLIIGFINVDRPKEWGGTKMHVQHGVLGPRQYTWPEGFSEYFFAKARKLAGALAQISEKQQQKMDQSFRANMERGAASETLKAMDNDVWLFGKAAFEDRA